MSEDTTSVYAGKQDFLNHFMTGQIIKLTKLSTNMHISHIACVLCNFRLGRIFRRFCPRCTFCFIGNKYIRNMRLKSGKN